MKSVSILCLAAFLACCMHLSGFCPFAYSQGYAPQFSTKGYHGEDDASSFLGSGGKEVGIANKYLVDHQKDFRFQPYHKLASLGGVMRDALYVYYSVWQDEMRIEGLDIKVRFSPNYKVVKVESNYRPVKRYVRDSETILSPKEVIQKLTRKYRSRRDSIRSTKKTLVIEPKEDTPRLAYWIELGDRKYGCDTRVLVRAHDAQEFGVRDGEACQMMKNVEKTGNPFGGATLEPNKGPHASECPINIIPGKQAGPMKIGQSIKEVKMSLPPVSLRKGEATSNYGNFGLVFCDRKLARIEVFLDSLPDCVRVKGRSVKRTLSPKALIKHFKKCGPVSPSRIGQAMSYVQCENETVTVEWYHPAQLRSVVIHTSGMEPDDWEKGFCEAGN